MHADANVSRPRSSQREHRRQFRRVESGEDLHGASLRREKCRLVVASEESDFVCDVQFNRRRSRAEESHSMAESRMRE